MVTTTDLLKIPLLGSMVWAAFVGAFRSPTPPPRAEETKKYGKEDLGDWLTRRKISLSRPMSVLLAVCEAAVILARAFPSSASDAILSSLVPRGASAADRLSITVPFLIGCTLVFAGAGLRLACYRTLGLNYNFQRSVREDHQLITTGPYAFVRHPAYTGYLIFAPGLLTAQLGRGSWVWESGVLESALGRAGIGIWVGYAFCVWVSILKRCAAEDATLHREFGAQWEEWSKRTPARLFPGIY
ncbi:ICMT-domain-containing protein [Trametes maxima]|nr:ICMT-domain-containing protein [Trametes maxima]